MRRKLRRAAPVLLGLGLLVGGGLGMVVLLGLEKPPAEAVTGREERPLHVQAMIAEPEDVPLSIKGFGEVRVLRQVSIAPEVSGVVVALHPNLVVGGVVPEGEALFRIESAPLAAALERARAEAAQAGSAIQRLQLQWETAKEQVQMHARSEALAEAQHGRVQQLLGEGIGSQFEVEQAEQAFVNARNTAEQARRNLDLYPLQLAEARDALKAAQAQVRMAELDLEKAHVKAPFTGRVRRVAVEQGQLAAQGTVAVELADDSVLEISVPLDSLQVRQGLRFAGHPPQTPSTGVQTEPALEGGDSGEMASAAWTEANAPPEDFSGAWFGAVEPVPCTIRWTEARDQHAWQGVLHRVESFDEAARTITVAVRVDGAQALSQNANGLPLVQGMFCEVEIPGRTLSGVYRLPASAVSFEQTAHLAVDNRLTTVPLEVARATEDYVLVSGGLQAGDVVITTRLVNPMNHTLLEVTLPRGDLLPVPGPPEG